MLGWWFWSFLAGMVLWVWFVDLQILILVGGFWGFPLMVCTGCSVGFEVGLVFLAMRVLV